LGKGERRGEVKINLSITFMIFIRGVYYYLDIYVICQGEFREENFQKAMAVIREGGTDPGSLKGRKGGTKGTHKDFIGRSCYSGF